MRIIIYIWSVICNAILLILQSTLFSYLFGHCHTCLNLGLMSSDGEDPYVGVDFSRQEWALGRCWPFDANEVLKFCSFIIFIVFTFLTFKVIKKFDKKWKKILYFIITIIFLWFQNRFVISAGTYM